MASRLPLADAYRAALPQEAHDVADRALEDLLRACLVTARSAWPGVKLDDETFVRYVAERTPLDASPDSLHTDELFLACACLAHEPAALRIFDQRYIKQLRAKVSHLKLSDAAVDDLEQQLRAELLVAEAGQAPKLASYRGQGELAGWLRVTAVRRGLRMLPDPGDVAADDESLAALPAMSRSPELAFVKAADHAAFKAAFREAMASLTPKEQNLLRQHYIDELSIDRLGELHRTHRTTCARWLRQAREALFRRTKASLMKATRASRSECESMIRQAQSQLEITFRSLLR